jgi:TrpR family trp operon transcriptional repressor
MNKKKFEEFIKELLTIKSGAEMDSFLKGILTESEQLEISTRLQIIKMLKAGISQHKIAQDLGVGVATVTRGSKEIQQGRFSQVKPYKAK